MMWANLPPCCPPRSGTAEAKASRPMTSYSHDDENLLESAPVSADALTPRGGFMARPGLKSPPRHAVVVRGGDAPVSEHIPVLRSSVPPPPPASEPAVPSANEKITLRAIPTPTPPAPQVEVALASSVPVVSDSLPPPSHAPSSRAPLSDAPFVTSPLDAAEPPRPSRSRWTIVAAAAAGLILGLASVAAKVIVPTAAEQPAQGSPLAVAAAAAPAPVVAAPVVASSATPPDRASVAPAPSSERAEPKPLRAPATSAKRSIF